MVKSSSDVNRFLADGEAFADVERYAEALRCFETAWCLLQEPKDAHDLAIQILGGVADCHFFLKAWDKCCQTVQLAFRSGAELDNPFFRLRIGQCLYELGDKKGAANWLVPVYLMEGRRPFNGEDSKYLDFFHDKLEPPEGGWPEGW